MSKKRSLCLIIIGYALIAVIICVVVAGNGEYTVKRLRRKVAVHPAVVSDLHPGQLAVAVDGRP